MNFTQEQLDTIQLPIRGKRIKLEVLNDDKQTLATLEGNATGGNLQKDATAFIRRSGSIQLAIPKLADATTFLDLVNGVTINVNGKIWLDKQIRISVGIDNYIQPYGEEPQTVWYNFGICLIDQPVRSFGADAYTMAFNVIDLTAKMNGDRGGQLPSLTTMIKRVQQYNGFSDLIDNPFSGTIGAMVADERYVYLGGDGGEFAIYDKLTKQFGGLINNPLTKYIDCLVVDANNVYIEASSDFCVYNKATRTFGTVEQPFGTVTSQSAISYLVQDDDNVYLAGDYGKFMIYSKSTGTFSSLIATPFGTDDISSMAIDSGNVYLGAGSGHFAIYNKATGTFGSLITSSLSIRIMSMVADAVNVYCGDMLGKFAVYNKSNGTFGSSMSCGLNLIYTMAQDSNFVYVGGSPQTSFGEFNIVPVYDKSTGVFVERLVAPINYYIRTIIKDGDDLYCSGGFSSNILSVGQFAIYSQLAYTRTKDALVATIQELGFIKEYTIYPIPEKWAILPYDIKVTVGQTVYDILKQFLDILNGWQMYFDNEGVFVVEPIPSGANDIVYPLNAKLNIVDTNSVDFNYVRNQVVVYGRSHEINFYTESVDYDSSNNLTLFFEAIDTTKVQVSSTIFGFHNAISMVGGVVTGTEINTITIKVSDGEGGWNTLVSNAPISIYGIDSLTPFTEMQLESDEIYVFRIKDATIYKDEEDRDVIDFTQAIAFEFLGKQQIAYSVVNGNPESPFYINKGYHTNRCAYGDNTAYTLTNINSEDSEIYTMQLTTNLGSIQQGDIITFISPTTNSTPYVYINITNYDGTSYASNIQLVSPNVDILILGKLGNDYTIWEMQYDGTNFVLNGHCPYALPLVESGGEFDNIYADELAKERATYDLFLHSNLQNTITLSCVPDYSLDVNYRIPYNSKSAIPPDSQLQDDFPDRYFITKQVTYPLGLDNTSQQVTAIEIYDDYNYVGYAYDLPTTN